MIETFYDLESSWPRSRRSRRLGTADRRLAHLRRGRGDAGGRQRGEAAERLARWTSRRSARTTASASSRRSPRSSRWRRRRPPARSAAEHRPREPLGGRVVYPARDPGLLRRVHRPRTPARRARYRRLLRDDPRGDRGDPRRDREERAPSEPLVLEEREIRLPHRRSRTRPRSRMLFPRASGWSRPSSTRRSAGATPACSRPPAR